MRSREGVGRRKLSGPDAGVTSLAGWLQIHPAYGIAPIDYLFNKMNGRYMNRWRVEFPDEQAVQNWRETWAEGLAREGITPRQFHRGLDQCLVEHPGWPPALGEFVKLCKLARPAAHENLVKITEKRSEQQMADGRDKMRRISEWLDTGCRGERPV